MAITTFTGSMAAVFPAGTTLKAYPVANWPAHKLPPAAGTAPLGSETASGTMATSGVLSLTGLADSAEYYVTDSTGTRYVRITTYPERQEVMTNQADQANGYAKLDANAKVPWGSLAGSPANVLDAAYGGKADAVYTTGTVTSGLSTLTLTSGGFTSADIGKVVVIGGAGATINLGSANGGTAVPRPLKGWIASVAGGVASLVTALGGTTPVTVTTSQVNTRIAYGTNLYDALLLAQASGRAIRVPAGDYIMVGVVTPLISRMYGDGPSTRIYVSNDFTGFAPANGTGLTGSALTLGSNAAAGDTSVALSSAPSTISAGDVMVLSSTATWETGSADNDAVNTKKGEYVRVQQVVSSTVYLEAPLADSYTTATTASLQAVTFTETGVHFSDMRFVNATPNVITLSAASPMALSQYGGGTNLFSLTNHRNLRFSNLEFESLSQGIIALINCIDWNVSRCSTRDSSRLGSFGYTVTVLACQWGEVTNCRARRSSSLFNAEGGLSTVASPKLPTRWVEVRDCVSFEGQHEPFLTHVTTEHVDFFNCRVYGGAFYQPEATHSAGFRVYGRNCRLFNCVAERVAGTAFAIGGPGVELHNPVIRNVVPNSLKSRGIDLNAANPGATGVLIRAADIDGVAQDGSNSEGHGIYIANGCTARIVGRNELRNVDGYGVYDRDTSEVTVIDGLDGVSHGSSSYGVTPYLIKHDGAGSTPVYRNVRLTSTRNSATRVTDKTGAMDNRYQKFTASGTIIIPDGVTKVRCRAAGGGGGGGGAGSAAAAQLQAGGGGGAGAPYLDTEVDVIPGETLTVTIGAGGTAGSGGAAGGNLGGAGGVGSTTTVVNGASSTLAQVRGGAPGAGTTASSTTAGNGGLWGALSGSTSGTSTAGNGGLGGFDAGNPMVCVSGGGGGGAATATLGGGGGNANLTANVLAPQTKGANGASGTSAGVNGVTATKPGCGGGGGGGGAAGTGKGGDGGVGADGFVELWW